MNYRLAYAIGFHPWEDAERDERFVAKISEMLDREESGRESPYGRALDLGTGSAVWAVQLAKRVGRSPASSSSKRRSSGLVTECKQTASTSISFMAM